MIKVDSRKEAWELANRLFPEYYERNEVISKNTGYPVYTSTKKGSAAYISDLNDRLELNYDDGRHENIWIEEKLEKDTTAIVGVWAEKSVFGSVAVKEVKEVTYHHVLGMVNETLEDGRIGIEISLANGDTATFGCEKVAYIRFE